MSASPQTQSPNEVKNADLKGTRARPRGGYKTTQTAKQQALKLLRDGNTVDEAMAYIGRSKETWKRWKREDPEFKQEADYIIGARRKKGQDSRKEVPDFPEFCEEYLGMKLFWHQLQWYDLLEGRDPRDLHVAQRYIQGADRNMLLVNTPPNHSKSTTITGAYTLWRILKNPNDNVIIVSKNEAMAKKWLTEIKGWLTNPTYLKLQTDFGPEGGFEKTSPIWNATQIYFGPQLRDKNAKDPTLEVLGMGGTIYGARASLIILDDVADTKNAHEYENQIDWLTRMVLTRPADEDKILIIGSRVAPVDIYSELMRPERYDDEDPPWTYFAQPAVLEFAEDPEDWVTLWPKSNIPKVNAVTKPDENGLYPRWDGPSLARMRKRLSSNPNAWTQGYQQEEVEENATFPRELVYGCVNGMRTIGRLQPGLRGHPASGMAGMRVIAGLDPASAGHTAAVVIAYDPDDNKRWLLNVHNQPNMTPDQIRRLMIGWTQEYGISEWRVEKVLLSTWITQDLDITRELSNMGCIIADHITTGATKWDADGGILSLSTLIQGSDREPKSNLLQIPQVSSEGVRALCEQMVTYFPKTKGKTDCLMALWFAEARIRELARARENYMFMDSPFTTAADRQFQYTVNLNELNPQESGQYVFSPFHSQRRAS